MNKPDYWEDVTPDMGLFQMGPKSHRVFLLNLLKDKGVETLLDVGCGTAPIWQLIRNKDLQYPNSPINRRWDFIYKGVDPSKRMIDVCRFHFPQGNFEVQDAQELLESENSWDCVLLMHSLDYVYEYARAIREATRVTNKYICIVFWRPINYIERAKSHLNKTIDGDEIHDWSTAHVQDFSWNDLEKEFNDNNLKVVLKESGEIINKEGINDGHTQNTLFLLEKI